MEGSLRAPAGWGWHPDALLIRPTEDDLPEIPGIEQLSGAERNNAVREALAGYPGVQTLWIVHRYGLPYVSAYAIAKTVERDRFA